MVQDSKITHQSYIDLCAWLAPSVPVCEDRMFRLTCEPDYLPLIALANNFWLTGALAFQLKNKGVWTKLPSLLSEYLATIEAAYLERSVQIQDEVQSVSQLLKGAGYELLLIKGAASLFNGAAKPISTRFMSDVDILVKRQDIKSAYDLLTSKGYYNALESHELHGKHHHHMPVLKREEGVCYIELHQGAVNIKFDHLLTADDAWQHKMKLELFEHIQVNQLSANQQVILTIVHSELSDRGLQDQHLELRQLYHLVVISEFFSKQLNWHQIQAHFVQHGQEKALAAAIYSAYQLFGLVTPITDPMDEWGEQHLSCCIDKYIAHQGVELQSQRLKNIVKGYGRQSIVSLYGDEGDWPVLSGRLKHIKRHIGLLVKKLCR